MFYSCDRYPECDFAAGNPPVKDRPCPECGSLLLARPKSFRCWNCAAELDLEFNVTKSGDPEAEAAARTAKAAAKAAKAAKAKKTPAKKAPAKSKAGAKKKTTARKKTVPEPKARVAAVPDAPAEPAAEA